MLTQKTQKHYHFCKWVIIIEKSTTRAVPTTSDIPNLILTSKVHFHAQLNI